MRRWFVLNYISPVPGRNRERAESEVERFNRSNNTDLQLFAPTIRQTRIKNGREEVIERPLTFHYVFLHATEQEAKRLAGQDNGFSLILSHTGGQDRYAVVSDAAMASFQRIALHYGNTLPFFSLNDVDLLQGDRIEIVDGEFAGLQGTYLPSPRRASGNVIVTADNEFASVIFDVKASHIKILEFSKSTRRPYDLIDAFIPRLLSAKETIESGESLSQKQLTDLILFTRRMEDARLDNHKIEAKLLGLLIAAKRLLGADDATLLPLRQRYARRLPTVTNPKTLALLHSLQCAEGDCGPIEKRTPGAPA